MKDFPHPAVSEASAGLLHVFVMGCSRGGTTLTQRLVAERLGLYTLPETRFFASLIGNVEERMFPDTQRRLPGLKPLTSRLREQLGLSTGMEYRDAGMVPAPRRRKWSSNTRISAEFVAGLDALTREAGLAGWLEKTPIHVHYAKEIQKLLPEAWMVHVIRDPKDTVASLWDVATRYQDSWALTYDRIERAVDNWNAATAGSAGMVGQERQIFLPYAVLAQDPQAVMDLVVRQIGAVDHAGSQIHAPVGLTSGNEDWKSAAVSGEVRPATSKWSTALSDDEQRRVADLIAPLPHALIEAMAPFTALAASSDGAAAAAQSA